LIYLEVQHKRENSAPGPSHEKTLNSLKPSMANSQFSLKGFLGGACKPPSRQVDPAEELNRVFEQHAKNVAAAGERTFV